MEAVRTTSRGHSSRPPKNPLAEAANSSDAKAPTVATPISRPGRHTGSEHIKPTPTTPESTYVDYDPSVRAAERDDLLVIQSRFRGVNDKRRVVKIGRGLASAAVLHAGQVIERRSEAPVYLVHMQN
jgi:hypothetical protein